MWWTPTNDLLLCRRLLKWQRVHTILCVIVGLDIHCWLGFVLAAGCGCYIVLFDCGIHCFGCCVLSCCIAFLLLCCLILAVGVVLCHFFFNFVLISGGFSFCALYRVILTFAIIFLFSIRKFLRLESCRLIARFEKGVDTVWATGVCIRYDVE